MPRAPILSAPLPPLRRALAPEPTQCSTADVGRLAEAFGLAQVISVASALVVFLCRDETGFRRQPHSQVLAGLASFLKSGKASGP